MKKREKNKCVESRRCAGSLPDIQSSRRYPEHSFPGTSLNSLASSRQSSALVSGSLCVSSPLTLGVC